MTLQSCTLFKAAVRLTIFLQLGETEMQRMELQPSITHLHPRGQLRSGGHPAAATHGVKVKTEETALEPPPIPSTLSEEASKMLIQSDWGLFFFFTFWIWVYKKFLSVCWKNNRSLSLLEVWGLVAKLQICADVKQEIKDKEFNCSLERK